MAAGDTDRFWEAFRAGRGPWWDAWWEADYSWEGLATKSWRGWVRPEGGGPCVEGRAGCEGRQATLQDYFQDRLGPDIVLVPAPDGRRFDRLHLPIAWSDGTPTGKMNWDEGALDPDLARLIGATEAPTGVSDVTDRHALLDGAVLFRIDLKTLVSARSDRKRIPISLSFERAACLGLSDFSKAAFNRWAWFDRAAFAGNASFKSASFAGHGHFENAAFAGYARFDSAIFGGDASFRNTVFANGAGFRATDFATEAIFRNVAFAGNASFKTATFGGDGVFTNAVFTRWTEFQNAAFAGNAIFSGAAFFGIASFESVAFAGYAEFGSAAFAKEARFKNSAFAGDARFFRTAFAGAAEFAKATFGGDASFTKTNFAKTAEFENTTFAGYAWFEDSVFARSAGFSNAEFAKGAGFENAAFAGDARFRCAAFAAGAWFENATFAGYVWFEHAAFTGTASFHNSAFAESAVFKNASFAKKVSFAKTAFVRSADFSGAWFEGDAVFNGCGAAVDTAEVVQTLSLSEPNADGTRQNGTLTTSAGLTPEAYCSFGTFKADDAVFSGGLDLTNRMFRGTSSFNGAIFLGLACFQGSRLHQGTTWHKSSFDTLDYLAVDDGESRTGEWRVVGAGPRPEPDPKRRLYEGDGSVVWHPQPRKPVFGLPWPRGPARRQWPPASLVLLDAKRRLAGEQPRSELSEADHQRVLDDWRAETDARRRERAMERTSTTYAAVEDAFRTLKQAMEDQRARLSEGRFFRLELMARRLRDDDDVQWWERVFSHWYGVLSDYGNSVIRPVGAFLIGLIAFALFYWLWGLWMNGWRLTPPTYYRPGWWWLDDTLWEALRYSGSRMLPFGALSDEDWCWRDKLIPNESSWSLIVRVIATLQSLFATVVSFLFALAIRRRFQIT